MPTCIIVGCNSRSSDRDVSFYPVPVLIKSSSILLNNQRREYRNLWLSIISRNDLTREKLKKLEVCSKHFSTGRPVHFENTDNPWVPTRKLRYLYRVSMKKFVMKQRRCRLHSKRIFKKCVRKFKLRGEKKVRRKKTVHSVNTLISILRMKNLISEEEASTLSYFSLFDELSRELFKKGGVTTNISNSHVLRDFAVSLNYFSPKGYKYVRRNIHCSLPNLNMLSVWYCNSEDNPGFSAKALRYLKMKVAKGKEQKVLCSLVFEEIQILTDRYIDFGVDLGDCCAEANEVLVFMLVSMNESWQLPLGYFFNNGHSDKTTSSLLALCLKLIENVGVIVTNITFDICQSSLNCANMYKLVPNNKIDFLLPDPTNLIARIRDIFEHGGPFGSDREAIDFRYLVQLKKLVEASKIDFNKPFSFDIGNLLRFHKESLKDPEFQDCDKTVLFIDTITEIIDILHSKTVDNIDIGGPICSLKCLALNTLSQHGKKALEGLRMCLMTLIWIHKQFVTTKKYANFLPLYKCYNSIRPIFTKYQKSSEHILTGEQFTCAFREALIGSIAEEVTQVALCAQKISAELKM